MPTCARHRTRASVRRQAVLLLCAALLPLNASAQEQLTIRSDFLFYGDNTEFRNLFREGETIFGAALRVTAEIALNDRVTLSAGGFANQRFGSEAAFEQARPVLSLTLRGRRSAFIFGTLPPLTSGGPARGRGRVRTAARGHGPTGLGCRTPAPLPPTTRGVVMAIRTADAAAPPADRHAPVSRAVRRWSWVWLLVGTALLPFAGLQTLIPLDGVAGAGVPAALQPQPARRGRSAGPGRRDLVRPAGGSAGRVLPRRRRIRLLPVRPHASGSAAPCRSRSTVSLAPRLDGIPRTLVFPAAVTTAELLGTMGNPFGTAGSTAYSQYAVPAAPAGGLGHRHLGADVPRQLAGAGGQPALGAGRSGPGCQGPRGRCSSPSPPSRCCSAVRCSPSRRRGARRCGSQRWRPTGG